MGTRIEKTSDPMSTRLRYIENRTKELEKLLSEHAFEQAARRPVEAERPADLTAQLPGADYPSDDTADGSPETEVEADHDASGQTEDARTAKLIREGRSVGKSHLARPRTIAIGVAVFCALIVAIKLVFFSGGPTWPASVTTVKAEIVRACQNPDVASEPGQVNFACGKNTQQVLWVLSLLTSRNDPQFRSPATGREGLEPISAAQGGDVAWSLNLHQPYDPLNPIDSLEVAARAINNIVGGATVIGSNGKTVVQPGLESSSANCARYTGSPAVVTHAGYPSTCALPVTSTSGQAALVADIYQQWVVGASSVAAQDAGVLFENSSDPGNSQVQAILSNPPNSGL